MSRKLVAAATAAGALLAPAAAQADQKITMPGKYFAPNNVTVLAGDAVTWQNEDLIAHDVAASGIFDSGRISSAGAFTFSFATPGDYAYRCTIHPFMTGNLTAAAVTLNPPTGAVLAGEMVTLTGRAPRGTARVGIERSLDGATWADTGTGATPADDGAFSAMIQAAAGTAFRAVVPAGASAAVTPQVAARVPIELQLTRHKHHARLHVRTAVAGAGLIARVETYKRERFTWKAVGKPKKLDRRGHTLFDLPGTLRGRARVVLSSSPKSLPLITSRPLRLSDGRPSTSPIPAPPAHGGEHGTEDRVVPAAGDDHGTGTHGA